jgi:hypothetical protein
LKIIALLPFRNEAHFLPTYVSSVSGVVDEILAVDHGSTDGGSNILRRAGALVELQDPPDVITGRQEGVQRQRLLEWGRQRKGTHFVCLDADEAFTAPFIRSGRARIGTLGKGEKLYLPWLSLWRSHKVYDDRGPWAPTWKDFVVHDDGVSSFPQSDLHVPRTAGEPMGERVPIAEGAVFHFQFVNWENFQFKQAWYRCWEYLTTQKKPVEINRIYQASLRANAAKCSPVRLEWVDGLVGLESIGDTQAWQESEIRAWFQEYGPDYFERLEIWHISSLRAAFVEAVGREPRNPSLRRKVWTARVAVANRMPWLKTFRRVGRRRKEEDLNRLK